MACVSKGLIVGGGIAGLSAAIALLRIGIQCDVVEKGEEPVGASMSLTGRATNALDELGIYDACCETGAPFTPEMMSPVMLDAAGEPLGPPAARPPQAGGKVGLGVFRPTFAKILEQTATGLGASIIKNSTIESIEDRVDAAYVRLSNGEQCSYDFVIGADGIFSRTRALVFPEAPEPAYAGQMSIRWMIPGPAIDGAGWYVAGAQGRLGFFHMPKQNMVYAPIVLTMPDQWLTQEAAYQAVKQLLDQYTAPAIVNLRQQLTPQSTLIARPFKWLFLQSPWHRGRTLLIGDAAHATTAHMGMGAGMALEDAVVLAQCLGKAATLQQAYSMFMERRFERVRTVVETSVTLSRFEQEGAAPAEARTLMGSAYAKIAQPY